MLKSDTTTDDWENEEDREFIKVDKEEYYDLLKDSNILNCLRAAGVDNWCGYEDALSILNYKEEDECSENKQKQMCIFPEEQE